MEPKRETGDDRVMIFMRPLYHGNPIGGWSVMEDREGTVEQFLEVGDAANSYEVRRSVVTAEKWNNVPEFEGW